MNAPRALLLALAGWSSLAAAGAQAGGTAADTLTARGACLDVSMACTAKLTPDTTGLGGRRAVRAGHGQRQTRWGRLTELDLRALFAYFKSQSPARNAVPDYQPPGPPAEKPDARD